MRRARGWLAHTATAHKLAPAGDQGWAGAGIKLPLTVVTDTDSTLLTYMNGNTPAVMVLADERSAPAQADHGFVRFVNLLTTRGEALDLYLNGQRVVQGITPQQVSASVELAAGDYQAEVKNAAGLLICEQSCTTQFALRPGDHHSLIAAGQTVDNGGAPLGLIMLRDQIDVALAQAWQRDFVVDQAPIGEWQVKLVGDITDAGWSLAVLNAANPPIINDFVMEASNSTDVTLWLSLQSDYSPTTVSFFVARGEITSTETFTNPDGTVSDVVVPQFHGEMVYQETITDANLLNGSNSLEYKWDLSFLASGEYHLWVQVEDGVNSSVNQYAGEAGMLRTAGASSLHVADADFRVEDQYADAARLIVSHADTFPTHFNAASITWATSVDIYYWDNTLCPDPNVDSECELFEGEWGKWVFEDFYPLDLEGLPAGLDADYVTSAGRSMEAAVISPLGRIAPSSPPAAGQDRVVQVARMAGDGSPTAAALQGDFDEAVTVELSAGPDVPR